MKLLSDIINSNRLLETLFDNLADEIRTSELYKSIADYFENYCQQNSIDCDAAIDMYMRFITMYNKHCKQFIKTGNYPVEGNIAPISISREHYDIVLLMSVLFTPHRFRIMELLSKKDQLGKALFIGIGPGLELQLTKAKHPLIHAYDIRLNQSLISQFPEVKFFDTYYLGQEIAFYDSIYLIELLEHLENPYELIQVAASSIKTHGHVILTTATDIPQFDHLYNFPENHDEFESRCRSLGLEVVFKEKLVHNYLTSELKPINHFYILQKTNS